jgi:signal transduction histidine kinase
MKLTTKVYLATALVATLGAATLGSASIVLGYQGERNVISKSLKSDVAMVDPTNLDALDDALISAQSSQVPVSIAFIDAQRRLSVIASDGPKISESPTTAVLLASQSKAIEQGDRLISTLKLKQGGYLVFETSFASANTNLAKNVQGLVAIYLATLALMVGLVWLTLRRDLRSIKVINGAALRIAEGDLSSSIPDKIGNSEIAGLARSLRKMVSRLSDSLEIEKRGKAAMESFVADASHELRTPLTVIRGYSELLTQGDAALRKSASEKIIREVDKMNLLVGDLLLLARLGEVGAAQLQWVEFDTLVREAFDDLLVLDSKRSIKLTLSKTAIRTDPDLVSKFLNNVTSNIHRYVPVAAKVEVTLKKIGSQISLAIEDGGPGLPEVAYQKGIRSFKRFDSSRSKEAGGTGLGMSIMHAIGESLGGKVEVSKSKLGGLSVRLELPVK